MLGIKKIKRIGQVEKKLMIVLRFIRMEKSEGCELNHDDVIVVNGKRGNAESFKSNEYQFGGG